MTHVCDFNTSNSSTDAKDFHRSGFEIVCCRACSEATKISASLIGRSIELSKLLGEELVRGIEIAWTLFDGDIFNDVSEPDLPINMPVKLEPMNPKRIKRKKKDFKTHVARLLHVTNLSYPSNISNIFPALREALRRLASRRSAEGSRGKGFLWMPKCLTLGVA